MSNDPEWVQNVPEIIVLAGEPPVHLRQTRQDDGSKLFEFLTANSHLADTHPWIKDITLERTDEIVDKTVRLQQAGSRLNYYIFEGSEPDIEETMVGSVGLSGIGAENRIAAAGIYIGQDYLRSGYGRRAVKALFEVAIDAVGLDVIGCQIEDSNIASQKLARSIGAVPTEQVQQLDVGDGAREFRIWGYWPKREVSDE